MDFDIITAEDMPRYPGGGVAVRLTPSEALWLIRSLSNQVIAESPNAGREEFTQGGRYLTVAVVVPDDSPDRSYNPHEPTVLCQACGTNRAHPLRDREFVCRICFHKRKLEQGGGA